MKKISLIILLGCMPAWLCAQDAAPADPEFPEETSAPAQPAKVEIVRPAKVETVQPAKVETVQPAKAEPVQPAKVEAASAVKAGIAAPVKSKRTAAAKKKPVSRSPAPVGPGNPAKPGGLVVMPKEEPSSRLISGELAAVSGISREAIESGGFVVGKMYTVVKGDTLWDLSGKYYKNPFLWGKIYNANFSTVADPDLINPADELIIPDVNDIVVPYRRAETSPSGTAEAGEDPEFGEYTALPASQRVVSASAGKTGLPVPGEILQDFDRNFLSEDMPEGQKEWSEGMKVVPDSWSEDGEITAKLNGESAMDDSLSLSGELVEISLYGQVSVKPGDYLAIYLKGGDAYSRSGKRLGRELQPAGLAEVVSVDGAEVKARVIDATTAISKGFVVKKK